MARQTPSHSRSKCTATHCWRWTFTRISWTWRSLASWLATGSHPNTVSNPPTDPACAQSVPHAIVLGDTLGLEIVAVFPCRALAIAENHINVEMDPTSECEARQKIADRAMRVVGWYHSHPSF